MGTMWQAKYYAPPGHSPQSLKATMTQLFAHVIDLMSPWEARSWISQFNSASAGQGFKLPGEVQIVLSAGLTLQELSGGAFNPGVGEAVIRRGFGPDIALPPQDYQAHNIHIEPDGDIIQPGGLWLDLNAIAKGYAVDLMAQKLRDNGISSFLVEIGGEFIGSGMKMDLSPWAVSLETEQDSASIMVAAADIAIATSGDTARYKMEEGKRISHIISDIETGELRSVSVFLGSCMMADGWATALFAAGAEKGQSLARAHDIPALFQFRGRPLWTSPALQAFMA